MSRWWANFNRWLDTLFPAWLVMHYMEVTLIFLSALLVVTLVCFLAVVVTLGVQQLLVG